MNNTYENVLSEFGKIWSPRVYELRILQVDGNTSRVDAGYFDDLELLAQAADRYGVSCSGIYTTLNEIDAALWARSANRVTPRAKNLTSDADVVRRRWLLVDLDAQRASGISATDAEHDDALHLASQIADDLALAGWPTPVRADSGNGAHLLWPIDWPNDADTSTLIQSWLVDLGDRYGNRSVKIDRTVYNPSRIWKLYGTVARKGSSTADRPHRQSRILHLGDRAELDIALLRSALKVHAQSSASSNGAFSSARMSAAHRASSEPAARTVQSTSFDVRAFMREHFPSAQERPWNGGAKWVLDKCPWNPAHTDRSAYVTVLANGAISAGCQHNSCAGRDWRSLRSMMAMPTNGLHTEHIVQTAHTNGLHTAQIVQDVQDVLPKTPDEGGLADLWLGQHRNDRTWAAGWQSWMLWTGQYWERDEGTLTVRAEIDDLLIRANTAAEQMVAAAGTDKALFQKAKKLLTATTRQASRVKGIEQLCQPRLASHAREFDQANLLNLANGTLDLDSFDFREHEPSDRLTSVMRYEYNEDAGHPLWSQFLRQVLVDEAGQHDESLAKLLQELFGYSLTTHTYMQAIVFQRGDGGNGKSIATGVLASLLESLAVTVEFEKLGEPGNRDLARIPGRRALLSTESKKGNRRIPEDILKRLSDGEPLISDQKFQIPFEYRPVGKIWWSMNHLPRVTDTTASIWRRLQVLPYNRKIGVDERDVHLGEKLLSERSGILNWALIGLERVASRRQFTSVRQVAETVDDYRRGSDPVRMFLDDECYTEPSPGRTQLWTAASPLFDAYKVWAQRNQFDRSGSMSSKEFANEMKRLGYPGKRSNDSVRYPVLLKLPEAHDGI